MEFDVIISVGVKDIFIVKKTIKYVNKHIHPANIYLLLHPKLFRFFQANFLYENHVALIDESEVVKGMDIKRVCCLVNSHFSERMRGGWYFQQFLKMGFARTSYANRYYLIWDADTIPTSPLSFFDEEGRMMLTQKEEYHKPYFATMNKLIGLDKSVDFSFIAEHMIICVEYMRDLICKIENSGIEGGAWYEKIINATNVNERLAFSEFETYGTYVHNTHPNCISYRKLHTMRNAGYLFGRMIKNKEINMFEGVTDTISVEVSHIPPFPRNILQYAQLSFLYILKQRI